MSVFRRFLLHFLSEYDGQTMVMIWEFQDHLKHLQKDMKTA